MTQTHNYINIDKVNIHYVESGAANTSADSQTIIFLHGFPEYWGTWKEQIQYFSRHHRVIAPDLPGYHLSDKPESVHFYEVSNLISFIAKFIAALSPKQSVILVAHDWGGAIAWPLAAFHPYLVKKLVILNAAHPSTFTREMVKNPIQRQKSAYIHDLIAPTAETLLSANQYQYLSQKMMVSNNANVFTKEVQARYRKIWAQDGAVNGMLQYYRAMPQIAVNSVDSPNDQQQVSSNVKHLDDIKIPNIRINRPTLVLWGENDQAFVNENLEEIEEYVPDCRIIRFAKTSHWIQHERPCEVNEAIDEFIN